MDGREIKNSLSSVKSSNPYFLSCRYEEHTEVPLGIKARVVAIYEPPQESTRDTVKLVEDENEQRVDEVNAQLGLRYGLLFF